MATTNDPAIYPLGPDCLSHYEWEKIPIKYDWLVYWYKAEAYDGSGVAVWHCPLDNRYGMANLGHCSCYGPVEEDQITETYDLETIRADLALTMHGGEEVWQQVELLTRKDEPMAEKVDPYDPEALAILAERKAEKLYEEKVERLCSELFRLFGDLGIVFTTQDPNVQGAMWCKMTPRAKAVLEWVIHRGLEGSAKPNLSHCGDGSKPCEALKQVAESEAMRQIVRAVNKYMEEEERVEANRAHLKKGETDANVPS